MFVGITSLAGIIVKYARQITTGILVPILILPLLLWIVGSLLGFWISPVLTFGGIILIYAILCVVLVHIPVWLSSLLIILSSIAGYILAPEFLNIEISTSSRYLIM